MQEIYRFIDDAIEADRQRYTDIADQIWDHPETRFEEFWSAEHLASALESAGFTVTRNVGNIPNAFIASFGQGKPVIALLGEYDALAGLSQQAGCAQPTSVTPGENGHGCGHNLLGTAAFAAAIAVKKWLEQYGQGGTVRFYGCPGEEGGSGKTFMVREGVFDDVDAALTWHPEAFAGMFNTRTLANIQASWRFKGIAAHAANSPHLGRSALDAVTLMTTGTNFLNEHIIEKARVHYAITNSGGISPNVVQAQAEVLYLIRAPEMTDVQHIYDRVAKIAEGAALYSKDWVSKAVGEDTDMYIGGMVQLLRDNGINCYMHDVSEGGIFGALWDMCEYGNVGLDVDIRSIPVRQEIIEICELFNVNPYELQSLGCLLMTADNDCDIINILNSNNIPAAVIGRIVNGNQRILHNKDEERFLTLPNQDEIFSCIKTAQ